VFAEKRIKQVRHTCARQCWNKCKPMLWRSRSRLQTHTILWVFVLRTS